MRRGAFYVTTMMSRRRASNVFSLFLQLLFSRHQKLASKNALDKRLSNVTLWIVKCTSFSRKDLRVSDLLYSNFSYDFVRFLMRALLVILFARNEGIFHHIQKRFRHFSPQESGAIPGRVLYVLASMSDHVCGTGTRYPDLTLAFQ